VIFGDNGRVEYAGPVGGLELSLMESTVPSQGGDDTIETGDGEKHIIGGFGADIITAGVGDHVVMGDNGRVNYDTDGAPKVLETTDTVDHPEYGGDDVITLGSGDGVIFGGMGSDEITTHDGTEVIFGDNGRVEYVGPVGGLELSLIESTLPLEGGDDTIRTGNGTKYIIGGFGSDSITTGTGSDILIGDNGVVECDENGLPETVYSTWPDVGGVDTLETTAGTNILIGGTKGDFIYGGSGRDAIFGDSGEVTLLNGVWHTLEATDYFIGGDDFMDGGAGNDVMMGGAGNNTFAGSLSEDIMIDTYGRVTFTPDASKVTSVIRLDTTSLIANVMTELEGGKDIGEIPEVETAGDREFADEGWLFGSFQEWGVSGAGMNLAGHKGSYGLAGTGDEQTDQPRDHHGLSQAPSAGEGEPSIPESETLPGEEPPIEEEATEENTSHAGEAPEGAGNVGGETNEGTEEDESSDEEEEGNGEGGSADAGTAAVAGMMGWKVLAGGSLGTRAATGVIDRESFRELAARQDKKRFKRWTSVGL